MGETWYRFASGLGPAADNMAWDEALLEFAARLEHPVFRLYGWASPAATFGYFQSYAAVARLTHLRPLLRRPTGGGLVPHDADWTYSLVFPPSHPWFAKAAVDSYRAAHEWIQAALQQLGLETELAPARRLAAPGQCFVGAERYDLLWQGQKIAGAAQRRNRRGLLIQGSMQFPAAKPSETMIVSGPAESVTARQNSEAGDPSSLPTDLAKLGDVTRTLWESAMREAAARRGIEWAELLPGPDLRQRAAILAAEKYARDEYNQRR